MRTKKSKKKSEEVELDDEEINSRVKAKLKEDKIFKQYRNLVSHIAESVNTDDIEAEAKRLHSGRKSRALTGTSPGPNALTDASLQDSANRSRLTQIRVDLTKQEALLSEAIDAIRTHVSITYRNDLPEIGTKGERLAYVNQFLRKGVNLRVKLSVLMSIIDLYIKDIDQTGFALKNAVHILELVYSKNNDRKSA
jgi:Fe-S cluster assembly scaffold protein SufB